MYAQLQEMKKLKVLFLQTFPLYGSGSGTYARYLAKEVNKVHKAGMLSPDTRPVNGVKIMNLRMPFHVSFTGHPEWPDSKLYENITNYQLLDLHETFMSEVVRAVEDFKPNIIHVHHAFPLSWAARFVKAAYGIPYIITVHGSEIPTAKRDKRYIALTTDVLRKAARIVPNSNYTKDWMFDVFGDEFKQRVRVVPGGVDLEKFKKTDTADIDAKFNLKGKKVVVFAGKLTKYFSNLF